MSLPRPSCACSRLSSSTSKHRSASSLLSTGTRDIRRPTCWGTTFWAMGDCGLPLARATQITSSTTTSYSPSSTSLGPSTSRRSISSSQTYVPVLRHPASTSIELDFKNWYRLQTEGLCFILILVCISQRSWLWEWLVGS